MTLLRFLSVESLSGLWGLVFEELGLCRSLFDQPMVPHNNLVNFKPAVTKLGTSFLMLWLASISLPSPGGFPVLLRLALLPVLLHNAFDIGSNKTYSLGSPLRDVLFPYWACLIVFRILDMAVVSLWDETPAPKWIKPMPLPFEGYDTRDLSREPSEKKDDDHFTINHDGVKGQPTKTATCCQWQVVPHPPLLSFDRMLYGLDIILLNRPGTPWVLPWRLRSLEWSSPALNGHRPDRLQFGQAEWPFSVALIQQVFHIMAHLYIRNKDLDGQRHGAQTLWQSSFREQIFMTFALGSIVAFGSSLEESITFPLLIKSKILPHTALLGHSRRAIVSSGLVDLWGYRWHHNWRRSFVRTARLFPGGFTPLGNALWTFFLSGLMHSIMFARTYPTPQASHPCSLIPIFWEPGVMFFFISQGVGTIIEKRFFPTTLPVLFRRIWMYLILFGTGRYLVNSMIVKGWLAAEEWNQLNYSNVVSDWLGWKVLV